MGSSVVVGFVVVFIGISVVVGYVGGLSGRPKHLIDFIDLLRSPGSVGLYNGPTLPVHARP